MKMHTWRILTFYSFCHKPLFSPFLLSLSSFPPSSLISPHIFPSFCSCLPFILAHPLPHSLFSPPVISTVQLTASVLWVSALALSFIQPFSMCEPVTQLLPEFHVCTNVFFFFLLAFIAPPLPPPTPQPPVHC